MSEAAVSSATLKAAIRSKFGGSGYQVFFEVGNDTGSHVRRHADAVSIGIWPSTGHAVHGFEIKISRGDWLREKAAPEKSQPIFRFCHRWSLVVPKGLVKADEIPPGWGLYELAGDRLRESVMPKKMAPEPMSPGFVAALVRRAGEADEALVTEVLRKARAEWNATRDAEIERLVERQLRAAGADRDRATKKLKELEEALGEPLDGYIYDLPQLAAAIKAVRKAGVTASYGGLAGVLSGLDRARDTVAKALLDAGIEPKREQLL
jgi:hypothetical protein